MLQEIEAEHTEFQSTLLMRGATSLILHKDTVTLISIHAPHARSDSAAAGQRAGLRNFNPRSSCEERLCQF